MIYFLHGYSGNYWSWTVTSEESKDQAFDFRVAPRKILERIDINRILYFEKLDDLIQSGELKPFILVQPDGSLLVPNIHKRKDLRGKVMTKGSFFVNSPYIGNYMDYIINDVINYIDSNYRTIADRDHRILMGASMGGYGALNSILHHSDKFCAVSALSPANLRLPENMNFTLRIPIYTELFGEKMSAQVGDFAWDDIVDTTDLICSNDNRLIATIKADEEGRIIDFNKDAKKNWENYNLLNLIDQFPESLRKVHLQINCEKNDDFGLTSVSMDLHEKLVELNIDHEYEIYSDPKAALTPHILGIAYHILPGIKFCLQYLS